MVVVVIVVVVVTVVVKHRKKAKVGKVQLQKVQNKTRELSALVLRQTQKQGQQTAQGYSYI